MGDFITGGARNTSERKMEIKMNFLMSLLLIATLSLECFHSGAQAASLNEATVNRTIQLVLQVRKPAIVDSTNKWLKKGDFSRGSFFKGEIPELKKIASYLKKQSPRVVSFSRGFIVTVGRGKSERKVKVEFIDPLMGRLRVAGQEVQIRSNMSYFEVAQALGRPILEPFLKKLQKNQKLKKKTSFVVPFDFLISSAKAQNSKKAEYNVREIAGYSTDFLARIVGNGFGVWTAVTADVALKGALVTAGYSVGGAGAASAGLVFALILGVVGVTQFLGTALRHLISDMDDKEFAKIHGIFTQLLERCHHGKLAGKSLVGEIKQDFMQLQAALNMLDQAKGKKKVEKISCHKFVSKESSYFRNDIKEKGFLK